jgi:hypothetical protein
VVGSAPTAIAATSNFRVTVSYTPTPTDPLLVNFTASVVPGTPTEFIWNFGDGRYFNGSGPGFFTPAHLYPAGGGTFTVTVTVYEGTQVNSTSLVVVVTPAPLSVLIHASVDGGTAPLTVHFTASVAGGSGTYPSVVWSFGDGSVGSGFSPQNTYHGSGRFLVSVNATDSLGHSALGAISLNVTVPPNASKGFWSTVNWPTLAAGAAIGAVVALAAAILLLRFRPRRAEPETPETTAVVEPPAPPTPTPVAVEAPTAPEEPKPDVAAPAASPSKEPTTTEALRTSQRIVLHLAGQGRLGPDEVAPLGFSQPGISQSLGVRQNALTNVLRRLVAAGVLVEDVRHVRGQPRRLKVYQLTGRGEALARELRHATRPPRPGNGSPP